MAGDWWRCLSETLINSLKVQVQLESKQEDSIAIYYINCQLSGYGVPTSLSALPVSHPKSYQLQTLNKFYYAFRHFCLCTVCYSFRTPGCWRCVPSGAESNYLKPSSPLFIRLSGCECDSLRLFVLFLTQANIFPREKKRGKVWFS